MSRKPWRLSLSLQRFRACTNTSSASLIPSCSRMFRTWANSWASVLWRAFWDLASLRNWPRSSRHSSTDGVWLLFLLRGLLTEYSLWTHFEGWWLLGGTTGSSDKDGGVRGLPLLGAPVQNQVVLPVGKPLQSRFPNREHESGTKGPLL